MAVRLAALTFDRSEALVVSSALDAAGIPNWIYWYNSLSNMPARLLIYDGYQIVVAQMSLTEAIAVLKEAREHPCADCETLEIRATFLDRLVSLIGGLLIGGAPFAVRHTTWREMVD